MSIIANAQQIPSDHLAIQYHEDLNQYFFEAEIAGQQTTRFWLNVIDPSRADGSEFIFDFFGTGEIYIPVPSNHSLISVSVKFVKMYVTNFLLNESLLRNYPQHPYSFIDLKQGKVIASDSFSTSATENEPIAAWHFFETAYFNIVDSSTITTSPVKSPIVCKYYSLNTSNLTIKSSEYKFANLPKDTNACSHPNISSNGLSPCPFQSARPPVRQSSCVMYTPDTKTLKSTLFNTYNTSQSFSIDLTYSLCIDGSHVFVVRNMQTTDIINTFYYPSDNDFDELYFEVEKIYFDYISCYVNDESSETSLTSSKNDTVSKQSYILSLLGSE